MSVTLAMLTVSSALAACSSVARGAHVGSYVDDTTISSRIKADMVADRNVDMSTIQVQTQDGIVVLSGTAKNGLERLTAESIAMKVNGARQVRNEIAVRP